MASILLVDDDASVLFTSALALRRRGHEVVVAQSGEQALQCLKKREFEFLISDIQMPGISGLELAAKAHEVPDEPHIILISAHYDQKRLPAWLSQVFLEKPLDFDSLDKLIEAYPEPRRLRRRHIPSIGHGWVRREGKQLKKPRS